MENYNLVFKNKFGSEWFFHGVYFPALTCAKYYVRFGTDKGSSNSCSFSTLFILVNAIQIQLKTSLNVLLLYSLQAFSNGLLEKVKTGFVTRTSFFLIKESLYHSNPFSLYPPYSLPTNIWCSFSIKCYGIFL